MAACYATPISVGTHHYVKKAIVIVIIVARVGEEGASDVICWVISCLCTRAAHVALTRTNTTRAHTWSNPARIVRQSSTSLG